MRGQVEGVFCRTSKNRNGIEESGGVSQFSFVCIMYSVYEYRCFYPQAVEGLKMDRREQGTATAVRGVFGVNVQSLNLLKEHLYIETTWLQRPHFTCPQGYTFLLIEPAYIDHLCVRTTFYWSNTHLYFSVYA